MATIPGFRLDITGASGSQGLLSPRQSWRAYVFPRGAFASQDSTGTLITFDSSSQASRFAVNNWIQVSTDTSKIVKVTAVGGNSISVNASVVVTTNDRIFLIGNTQPSVSGGSATYITPNTLVRQRGDDSATLYANSMITTNANGLVQGFASPAMYDVLVQDGNGSNQGYVANLEVGTVEGVSVTDWAYFGSSVTMSSSLTVGATTILSGGLSVSGILQVEASIGVHNVKAYGALGDGSTDDSTAINAALAACGTGEVVYFPTPSVSYKITSALTSNVSSMQLMGQGGSGQSVVRGSGAVQILVSGASSGFVFNPTAASTNFRGPRISNLHFVGDGSASQVGIHIKRTNNFVLENVIVSGFTGTNATGIHSDGTGNVNQYGTYVNVQANKCTIGFKNTLTNGLRVFGGMIDANDNTAAVVVGSTAFMHISGDTLKVVGLVAQYADSGFDIQAGDGHNFTDCRTEGMNIHYSITGGNAPMVISGSATNTIIGGTGTVFVIGSAVQDAWLQPGNIASVTTIVSDSGTRTSFLGGRQSVIRLGKFSAVANERLLVTAGSGVADAATFYRGSSANVGVRMNFAVQNTSNADKAIASVVGNALSSTAGQETGELQVQGAYSGSLTVLSRFLPPGYLGLVDGVTAPTTLAGYGQIFIDAADGDLKIKFGDGTLKTIVVDT